MNHFQQLLKIRRVLRHGEQQRHKELLFTVFQLETEAVFRLESSRVAIIELKMGQAHP